MSLSRLLREVRACQVCAAHLPLGARPVLQLASTARLLIVGQAPGSKVHQSGIPWSDASGERLRDWLQMDRSIFYDKAHVAILPMGLCYPGAGENRGDLPPRPECAPRWHEQLLKHLPTSRGHGLGGSVRSAVLLGIAANGLRDGNGSCLYCIQSSILPATTPQLAQRYLDAPARVVRAIGHS